MVYFGLTTLSTIGFGDLHPRSDAERVYTAIFLLCGVAVFSNVMGIFIEYLTVYKEIDAELEENEQLEKFFGVLLRFNKNKPLN
jgi:ABC-type siderophore export system fused ATPase/permease subunit